MSEHLITDNVLVAFETIHHINKKITSEHKEEYHQFYYRLTNLLYQTIGISHILL